MFNQNNDNQPILQNITNLPVNPLNTDKNDIENVTAKNDVAAKRTNSKLNLWKRSKNARRNWLKPDQLIALEKQFAQCMYIDKENTAKLADESNLNKDQIRMWFQNRRLRNRRPPRPKKPAIIPKPSIFGNLPHLKTKKAQNATPANVQIDNCGNWNHSSSCCCSNGTILNYNQPLTPLFQTYVGPMTPDFDIDGGNYSTYFPSSDFMSNYEYDFFSN